MISLLPILNLFLSLFASPELDHSQEQWRTYCVEHSVLFSECYRINEKEGRFVYELFYDDFSCVYGEGSLIAEEDSLVLTFDPLEAFSGLSARSNEQSLDTVEVYFQGYEHYPFPAGRVILSDKGKRKTYTLHQGLTQVPKLEIAAYSCFGIELIDRTYISFSSSVVLAYDNLAFDPSFLENNCATNIINDQVKILKKQGRKRLVGNSIAMGQEEVYLRLR